MASNINLGPARVVTAALLKTPENGYRFSGLGGLTALRSPQLKPLIDAMNPANAANEGRLSVASGGVTPTVTLNYKAKYAPTVKTSRTVATGTNIAAASSATVAFSLHREYDMNFQTPDLLAVEAQTEQFLAEYVATQGKVKAKAGEYNLLGIIGDEFLRTVEDGMLTPVNTQCVTALNTAAGLNLLYTGAAGASQTIDLFDSAGSPKTDFFREMVKIKQVHGIKGKLIVIGGLTLMDYLGVRAIASPADTGFDFTLLYDKLPIEFYFDSQIDTIIGAGEILVVDPGAACLETIMEHGQVIKSAKVANTSYGSGSIGIVPGVETAVDLTTYTFDFDFRVKEYDTAYPTWTVTPSVKFGIFTRPAGYHSSVGSWATVTGIFKYVVTV